MTREEAIDVLCNTNLYPGRCGGKTAFSEALNMAISALKAQSDNDDAISRQAAIDAFSCCELTPDGGIDANDAIDILKQLPPVQPEIVYCKDCEFRHKSPDWKHLQSFGSSIWYCGKSRGVNLVEAVELDDYCSSGERRTDG